ncbi:DUF6082 family protein [Streptomyces sp. NPDC092369]|uniref:DUF6082 family protein n=1 Tax=Streptomyces sp. NPDC092369 TaxID=3366015 RepID=UPI0038073749
MEQRSLELESEKARKQMLLATGRQRLDLLRQAMDDPQLAEILNTYPSVRMGLDGPEPRESAVRRYLFCQALYEQEVLAFRVGVIGWEELYGRMRILLQNPHFREWWQETKSHRASLPRGSVEARIGSMVDTLVEALEDADADDWWAAGDPPDWSR